MSMAFPNHPPSFGDNHPWNDPLGPQDLFDPRPDSELAMAGGFAPDPQSFPFTPEGRREYYSAVRSAAQQMQMQQMQMQQMQTIGQARISEEAAAGRRREEWFLLS
jgi:hypothetical protein